MKLKLLTLITILTIVLSACTGVDSDPLDGTSWMLIWLGKESLVPPTSISLTFEDGQASGNSGCNSYGGGYQVNGDKINFQELESTLMACIDPSGVMEQESAYLMFLGEAQRFEIE